MGGSRNDDSKLKKPFLEVQGQGSHWGLFWYPLQVMLGQHGWRQYKPVHTLSVSFSSVPLTQGLLSVVSAEPSVALQMWQREAQQAGAYSGACLPGDCSDLCLNQPWKRKEIRSGKAQA